jgi:hypothetical protein
MDKQETPFRIGGVYRNQGGAVARLVVIADAYHHEKWHSAFPAHTFGHAIEVSGKGPIAYVSLVNGRSVRYMEGKACVDHLLPGELHCVNGEWVPISDEPGTIDADGFYKEHAAILAEIERADAAQRDTPEPHRPPLDWNAPTPFDAFKGYSVSSGSSDPHAYSGSFGSTDLTRAAHQVAPMFGSAYLTRD